MFDEVKCARFKSNVTALDKEKKEYQLFVGH